VKAGREELRKQEREKNGYSERVHAKSLLDLPGKRNQKAFVHELLQLRFRQCPLHWVDILSRF
jgi:hypothetical protein